MMTQFAHLAPDAHIDEAVETLLRTSQSEFPVVDADGRLVGVLGRGDMIRALKQHGPDATVADAMTSRCPDRQPSRLPRRGDPPVAGKAAPAVGVVDAAGKLAGLITSETIGEMLMVRDALPKGNGFRGRRLRRGSGASARTDLPCNVAI